MPTHAYNDAIPVTADTEAVVYLIKQLDDCKTPIDLSSCLRVRSIGKSGFRFENPSPDFPIEHEIRKPVLQGLLKTYRKSRKKTRATFSLKCKMCSL